MVKKVWKSVKVDFVVKSNTTIETDKYDLRDKIVDSNDIRKALPTTTNANRQFDKLIEIPTDGPFYLGFSNVHFAAEEECIRKFFKDFTLIDICFNAEKRGNGIIEFKSVEDMKSALELNGKFLVGRPISLNVITSLEKETMLDNISNQRKKFIKNGNDNKISALDESNWRVKRNVEIKQTTGDESDNWRIEKKIQTESKPIDSDNWRIKKDLPKSEKTKQLIDSDNWRIKKDIPKSEMTKPFVDSDNWRIKKDFAKSEMTKPFINSNNWRTKQNHSKSNFRKTSIDSDNWRKM